MVWSVADERFQKNLETARAYYEQHWSLCAPRTAAALDRPLGQWLSNRRRPGALDGHPEWEAALRKIDEHWDPAWPADWQRHYAALRELVREGFGGDVGRHEGHGARGVLAIAELGDDVVGAVLVPGAWRRAGP
ncbi:hypothetical protein GCM10020367_72480 [Streptomyces sannanensis]|uniref:Helicase-associated domain-containing protein n=1 Tax=Streptomyces sannanensis TaxID=285536 RepID=A0ABP6SPL7_9ACTN